MTSTKHTHGPWIIEYQEGDKPYIVSDQGKRWNNPVICDLYSDVTPEDSVTIGPWLEAHENAKANARRIVACVNACNGFSIEEIDGTDLFKDSIESCNLIDELQAQRDELLSLLTEVAGNFTRDDDLHDNLIQRIDAAIDKVKRTKPATILASIN